MGRQLRLLEWWWYPMIRMPSYICAENLVELKMPDSQLEFLWGGVQNKWRNRQFLNKILHIHF
ncbi:hypothetical protein YC2023_103324 [Brassica napus]